MVQLFIIHCFASPFPPIAHYLDPQAEPCVHEQWPMAPEHLCQVPCQQWVMVPNYCSCSRVELAEWS